MAVWRALDLWYLKFQKTLTLFISLSFSLSPFHSLSLSFSLFLTHTLARIYTISLGSNSHRCKNELKYKPKDIEEVPITKRRTKIENLDQVDPQKWDLLSRLNCLDNPDIWNSPVTMNTSEEGGQEKWNPLCQTPSLCEAILETDKYLVSIF